jgi:hypothetical protein
MGEYARGGKTRATIKPPITTWAVRSNTRRSGWWTKTADNCTRFLQRMVEFADHIGKSIQLLYYPPYHSKYNPVERCRGILEQHWNGARLVDVDVMLGWAASMSWKGIHPVVTLTRQVYEKGVTLSKQAMQAVEARLERNPLLPKWDILIRPA